MVRYKDEGMDLSGVVLSFAVPWWVPVASLRWVRRVRSASCVPECKFERAEVQVNIAHKQ